MLALLSGLFAALFSEMTLTYVAIKVVLVTLMITILPIIIKNLLDWFVTGLLAIVAAHVQTTSSTVMSLVGLAGYFASGLGVPDCFAVIVSAIAIKFTLGLIPFVRL